MSELLLSVFPGIDLLGRAVAQAVKRAMGKEVR